MVANREAFPLPLAKEWSNWGVVCDVTEYQMKGVFVVTLAALPFYNAVTLNTLISPLLPNSNNSYPMLKIFKRRDHGKNVL